MIYAHTYQPNARTTVLSLSTIKTLGVELFELATPEDAMSLIQSSGVQDVSFGLFGLPRHPVPVTHKKLGQYVRKMFKAQRP